MRHHYQVLLTFPPNLTGWIRDWFNENFVCVHCSFNPPCHMKSHRNQGKTSVLKPAKRVACLPIGPDQCKRASITQKRKFSQWCHNIRQCTKDWLIRYRVCHCFQRSRKRWWHWTRTFRTATHDTRKEIFPEVQALIHQEVRRPAARAYDREYKRYIVLGPRRMKVTTRSFSVIKPKITSVSQLPV